MRNIIVCYRIEIVKNYVIRGGANLKNSIKTLAMWLIIGIIFIVLLTSIIENTDTKLAYSELISKIEAGEVEEIVIDSDGHRICKC